MAMRKSKLCLLLTGAAKEGLPDNPVQLYTLSGALLARVNLPGREADMDYVKHDITINGVVVVRGALAGGEIMGPSTKPIVVGSKRRRLTPLAPFTICFKLPAHVQVMMSGSRLLADGTFDILFILA